MFILTDRKLYIERGVFPVKKEYEVLEIEIKEFTATEIMAPSDIEDGGEVDEGIER